MDVFGSYYQSTHSDKWKLNQGGEKPRLFELCHILDAFICEAGISSQGKHFRL